MQNKRINIYLIALVTILLLDISGIICLNIHLYYKVIMHNQIIKFNKISLSLLISLTLNIASLSLCISLSLSTRQRTCDATRRTHYDRSICIRGDSYRRAMICKWSQSEVCESIPSKAYYYLVGVL